MKKVNKFMNRLNVIAGAASVVMLGLIVTVAVALGASPGGDIPLGSAKTEHQVIVEMHKMANNYIVADEIWGKEPITHEKIAELRNEIKGENTVNRGTLVDILDRWDAGLFYTIDRDHNELWTMLGGTVGKATGVVSDDKLPAWHVGTRSNNDEAYTIAEKDRQRKAELDAYNAAHGTNIPFEPQKVQ